VIRLAAFALGFVATASLVASVFFLRFYRESRDPLFLYFAGAFGIEALNRTLLAFMTNPSEGSPTLYLLRACAYSLIIVGIYAKNRQRR
jgi:hypothetical protein